MIVIKNTIISDDIVDQYFACDLVKCKGACCHAGDRGAPLEIHELTEIDICNRDVKTYLNEESQRLLDSKQPYIKDVNGQYHTTVRKDGACIFSIVDKNALTLCGIERAYTEGKVDFRKPVSCQLYPVRVKKYPDYYAVNYHKWDICKAACVLGKRNGVKIYEFVKDALIKKFGKDWYEELSKSI